MYQRVTQHDFIEAFRTMGRYDRSDGQGGNFTYEALLALFDYLEEYEDSLEEANEIELDVIALCCEFAEYDSIEDAASEYNMNRAELRDNTPIIEIPGTDRIIIQQF